MEIRFILLEKLIGIVIRYTISLVRVVYSKAVYRRKRIRDSSNP